MNVLKFNKPPVLEVWVEFRFTPNEQKEPWDAPVAQKFLRAFQPEFTAKNGILTRSMKVDWPQDGSSPQQVQLEQRLERVQARNDDESEWIQIADDILVFNLIRKNMEKDYPGFPHLKKRSFRVLDEYIKFFSPKAVKKLMLHYVDLVEIPGKGDTPVDIEEYLSSFLPRVDSSTFGSISNFRVSLEFAQTKEVDSLEVTISRDPSLEGDCQRLRIDWHAICRKTESLGKSEIGYILDKAHGYLLQCFRKSFTDKGLDLFEPVEEN